jgi:hypothetical protein
LTTDSSISLFEDEACGRDDGVVDGDACLGRVKRWRWRDILDGVEDLNLIGCFSEIFLKICVIPLEVKFEFLLKLEASFGGLIEFCGKF